MRAIVVRPGIGLLDEDAVRGAVPDAAPCLVRPAEAEREVGLAAGKDLRKWPVEELPPGEPVVPVAERCDAVLPGEICLGASDLGHPQVVEAEVGGQVRLVVAAEHRPPWRRWSTR